MRNNEKVLSRSQLAIEVNMDHTEFLIIVLPEHGIELMFCTNQIDQMHKDGENTLVKT